MRLPHRKIALFSPENEDCGSTSDFPRILSFRVAPSMLTDLKVSAALRMRRRPRHSRRLSARVLVSGGNRRSARVAALRRLSISHAVFHFGSRVTAGRKGQAVLRVPLNGDGPQCTSGFQTFGRNGRMEMDIDKSRGIRKEIPRFETAIRT